MCGITGIYSVLKEIDKELLVNLTDILKHRGPDDCGYFIDDNIGLGHRRLSIIDLETGHQPISNEDNSVVIVYNGEFYNFKEYIDFLKSKGHKFKTNTDTEVILHLYEEIGTQVLDKIRGMFTFAIWDKNKSTLFIARDRLGQKPLFYTFQNDKFYFSSELKSFFKINEIKKDIDRQAIDYYLTYQYIPAPLSVYKNIYKLMPAEYIIVKNGKIIEKKNYWQLPAKTNYNISYADAKEQLRELLFESVKLRLVSDVPVGSFLSGGVDSSIITAIMAKTAGKQIKTFSIGFDEGDYNELPYAKLVADKYNTEHKEFIVKPDTINIINDLAYFYNEPYADSSALPTYYLSKMTSKYVKVALNGDAGDEMFCGYYRYQAMRFYEIINNIPLGKNICKIFSNLIPSSGFNNRRIIQIRNFLNIISKQHIDVYKDLVSYFYDDDKNNIYTDEFRNSVDTTKCFSYITDIFNNFNDVKGLTQKIMFTDQLSYLPNDLLVKVDIASMMNSIECRSPILDHKVVEFANSLPLEYKLRGFKKKHIFTDTFKDLIPSEIINRKKMGFGVPLFHWFRNELKDFAYDNILNAFYIKNSWFKKDKVQNILDNHVSKKENNAFKIWSLLMLSLWYNSYYT